MCRWLVVGPAGVHAGGTHTQLMRRLHAGDRLSMIATQRAICRTIMSTIVYSMQPVINSVRPFKPLSVSISLQHIPNTGLSSSVETTSKHHFPLIDVTYYTLGTVENVQILSIMYM